MFDRKEYTPVRSISLKGKFLIGAIRLSFGLRRLFGAKDWDSLMPGHHEDPKYMRTREILYLAHKYYYRMISRDGDNGSLSQHFKTHSGEIIIPDQFEAENSITLSAGGDLMPYFCINKNTCSSLWDECGDFFFTADLVTANLESPIDLNQKTSKVPEVMLKNMYFNSNSEMFDVFSGMGKYKGYQVLSMANNHSLDQGETGLLQTLNFLEGKNIQYCGAAKNSDERDNFPVIEKNGIKVAFLAATFSLNALSTPPGKEWLVNHLRLNTSDPDIQLLINQSKLARERGADFIVAHLHMGLAYQPYPSLQTVTTIRRICEHTGIDIILGGHPHNVQPFEFFSYIDPFSKKSKQSFVVYSMGDFVAYDVFKWCHLPLMIKFCISKNKQGTVITKLEMKLAYMQAHIHKGKVSKLQFRDFKKLAEDDSALDAESLKEFQELKEFATSFLLPGNIEKYLV